MRLCGQFRAPRRAPRGLGTEAIFLLFILPSCLDAATYFVAPKGSDLIDKGVNVGLPYNGSAPDLGAFEYVAQTPIRIDAASMTGTGLDLHVTGLTSHGLVIVHTSPDLAAWTPVYTNSPVTGGWQYLDSAAINLPQRFYKVQEQ